MPDTTDNSVTTINGIDLSAANPTEINFRQFTDAELNALQVASITEASIDDSLLNALNPIIQFKGRIGSPDQARP